MTNRWERRAILAAVFLVVAGCNEFESKKSPSSSGKSTAGGTNSTDPLASTGASTCNGTAGVSDSCNTSGAGEAGTANAAVTSSAGSYDAGAGSPSDWRGWAGSAATSGMGTMAGAAGMVGTAGTDGALCGGGAAQTGDVVVKLASLKQKISGFGASTAWYAAMSSSDADLLWSTTNGAGLSLHRVRIDYRTGHTNELTIAQLAVARGVKVWATPWTPPVAAKNNASEVGGTLTDGAAFAAFLANFVSYMKGQGVDIYAVSAQNEPDASVTYESCSYTGETLAAFVGNYMGPTFANIGVKVIAPETQNWCGFPRYLSAILADANATKYTDIIATHEYGCNVGAYPQIAQAGKEFWETEIYDTVKTQDAGMGSALRVAKLIHDALTIAEMNAWHYWWVYPSTTDNGALWDKTTVKPSKRLWVMGNFSRFVRPGYRRVELAGAAPNGVLVSSYTNPNDGTVVIVAINNNATATTLSLFLSGPAPCVFTPWATTESDALSSKDPVSVTGARLVYPLASQSVTTFVAVP